MTFFSKNVANFNKTGIYLCGGFNTPALGRMIGIKSRLRYL